MSKKRVFVLVCTISMCTIIYGQHPHSHGGNPLYWALVGGISAGMLYAFYLLFGVLVNFVQKTRRGELNFIEKFHSLFPKTDKEGKMSGHEMHSDILADGEELLETSSESCNQGVTLCKHCGKQIPAAALYCNYCGASQSKTPSVLRRISLKLKDLSFLNTFFKRFVRFILILMLLALLGGVIALLCNEIGDSHENNKICVLAPIVTYLLYHLLVYAYTFSRKRRILTITIFSLLVLALWGICITDSIRHKAYKQAEAQREMEMHRVNRTFLGCSFGDNSSKVSNTLRKYVPNHLLPATRLNGSEVDEIWLEDISYGDYTLNTISFLFCQDKLYKVVMNVKTAENESYSELWTYNHLATMLSKKYEEDFSAPQYNNTEYYCDAHTEVKLWHATYGMGKYEVTLTYYDKDSGYTEHQEEGF